MSLIQRPRFWHRMSRADRIGYAVFFAAILVFELGRRLDVDWDALGLSRGILFAVLGAALVARLLLWCLKQKYTRPFDPDGESERRDI
jgi:hypothetical protein